jgi:hypothetical protein
MKFILALLLAQVVGDPGAALRERYLGPTGLPSEAAYAQAHGATAVPGTETFAWQVVFRLTYASADLTRRGDVQPVHADCYFIRTRKYLAPNRVQPVWDGRVYQANGRLVVAAYTSKGESAYGYVDERSRVVPSDDTQSSSTMPDLTGAH